MEQSLERHQCTKGVGASFPQLIKDGGANCKSELVDNWGESPAAALGGGASRRLLRYTLSTILSQSNTPWIIYACIPHCRLEHIIDPSPHYLNLEFLALSRFREVSVAKYHRHTDLRGISEPDLPESMKSIVSSGKRSDTPIQELWFVNSGDNRTVRTHVSTGPHASLAVQERLIIPRLQGL
ncbi:hypothetical protein J6590_071017 [Homalodisca vitripennis]|nr:hypothetical protein J6590_071017 [Homalodisca vitripennis]